MALVKHFSGNVLCFLKPRTLLPSRAFIQTRLKSSCKESDKKPPCSDFEKCKRGKERILGCYKGSRVVPKCRSEKQTNFKPAAKPKKSIWETDPPYQNHLKEFPDHKEECYGPCDFEPPRFDDLYYRASNKKRKYQQTWVECPELKIVSKCLCNFDKIKMEYVPRPPPCNDDKNKTATCRIKGNEDCPLIRAPCCKRGRIPPSCVRNLKPSGCKKRCCPFPSYSECCQEKPARIPGRPYECFCLARVPNCILYRELKKQKDRK